MIVAVTRRQPRRSTRSLTSSLRERNVTPERTIGGVSGRPAAIVGFDPPVGVADDRGVAGARAGVELARQHIIERACLAEGDGVLGIVAVAEDDRLGRAGLLAGGHDLAVAHRAVLALGVDLRDADALDAIGAFSMTPWSRTVTSGFHDSASAAFLDIVCTPCTYAAVKVV
jgi:hypothetical protein